MTPDFTVTGSATLILCNMQLTVLERFSTILAIYDALQHNINWKMQKCEFFEKIKNLIQIKKSDFFILKKSCFSNPERNMCAK